MHTSMPMTGINVTISKILHMEKRKPPSILTMGHGSTKLGEMVFGARGCVGAGSDWRRESMDRPGSIRLAEGLCSGCGSRNERKHEGSLRMD